MAEARSVGPATPLPKTAAQYSAVEAPVQFAGGGVFLFDIRCMSVPGGLFGYGLHEDYAVTTPDLFVANLQQGRLGRFPVRVVFPAYASCRQNSESP